MLLRRELLLLRRHLLLRWQVLRLPVLSEALLRLRLLLLLLEERRLGHLPLLLLLHLLLWRLLLPHHWRPRLRLGSRCLSSRCLGRCGSLDGVRGRRGEAHWRDGEGQVRGVAVDCGRCWGRLLLLLHLLLLLEGGGLCPHAAAAAA